MKFWTNGYCDHRNDFNWNNRKSYGCDFKIYRTEGSNVEYLGGKRIERTEGIYFCKTYKENIYL